MDQETLTITLRTPITDKGATYEKVELREPTAGELAETSGLEGYPADIKIVSVVSAMPESAVRQIPAREFLQASRFLGVFLQPAPATGDDA